MREVVPKCKFKGPAIAVNAPEEIGDALKTLGFKNELDSDKTNADVLVFVNNKSEFLDFLNLKLKHIRPDSVLWFAYPKGSSKIKTDVNRDILWKLGEDFGITSVAAISIDAVWSAIRFRPIEKVGKR